MLGDTIERALSSVGITSALVKGWVGAPCGCEERKQKLNALHHWARRVIKGKLANAQNYLNGIMGLSNDLDTRR